MNETCALFHACEAVSATGRADTPGPPLRTSAKRIPYDDLAWGREAEIDRRSVDEMRLPSCKWLCIVSVAMCASAWSEGDVDMPMLNWVGRKETVRSTKDVVMKILREDKSLSYRGEDVSTQRRKDAEDAEICGDVSARNDNILVHGDNLEALKALLPFYAGQVKCIYIDPPYNTGSAFEHYNDNLEHSKWLNMMYPRLALLRDFLREDGSIWISIDDDEQAYLKVVCDEIFGRQNFVATVVWQKRTSPDGRLRLGDAHDYILVYQKCKDKWQFNQIDATEDRIKDFKNPDNDPRGPWASVDMTGMIGHATPNQFYTIVSPGGVEFPPPAGRCWALAEDTFNRLRSENRIWFGVNGKSRPRQKRYLSELQGQNCWTWWTKEDVGHNQEAKKEVNVLFGPESPFDTPKPERLMQRVLTLATNEGDLVLDSFLGSGTTAAVAHKMNRRWIGIEMGEHAKTHCAVRLRKVINGEQGGISKAVGWKGGGGFSFFELGEPIVDENGAIAESVEFETLAAHIWWRETGTAWQCDKKSTVLGVHKGVAYALLYNGILHDRSVGGGNVLTSKTLRLIREDLGGVNADKIVVYAECTRLGEDKLKSEDVEFRQTPYDIIARR